jgi:hypothetical protein
MPRVKDYLEPPIKVDKFVKIADILDLEVEILEVHHRWGDYGDYVTIVVEHSGRRLGFNTGSKVVMDALAEVEDKLPVQGRFERVRSTDGKFYYRVV